MINIIHKGILETKHDKDSDEFYLQVTLYPDDYNKYREHVMNMEAEDPDRGYYIELEDIIEGFMDDIGIVVVKGEMEDD